MKIYRVMIIILLSVPALCRASELISNNPVETTRTVIEQWVEVQGKISKAKNDWTLEQETLSDRIEMYRKEIASLQEKIAKGRADVNEADKHQIELFNENERLKNASESFGKILTSLEVKTLSLDKKLPESIRENDRIKPLRQRIPEDPNQSKLSLSQRFMNVIGILNELNKFNYEISVTSEVQKSNNGDPVEVTALYIGLGQGYYVNTNGTIAGVGRPTPNGWSWESADGAAKEIQDAISILKNEKIASFIPLPVKVE